MTKHPYVIRRFNAMAACKCSRMVTRVTLVGACIGVAVLTGVLPTPERRGVYDKVVEITGVDSDWADDGSICVYSGEDAFDVSDYVDGPGDGDTSLFLFQIGKKYHIKARDAGLESSFGHARRVVINIDLATPDPSA